MEQKKIFISYSWSSPAHEGWVVDLANRLVQDGVDVMLDKWELKEGHDKFHFMEGIVKSPDIHKVLIILDKKYAERADERKGGVGTETLIITPQLYADMTQEKFIPVVAQVDEDGKAYLPVYLASRIYIDLSDKDRFEAGYEQLLRSIFSLPSLTKPALGKPPKYLFEDSPVRHKTTALVRALDLQLDKYPGRADSFLQDFLDEYFKSLPNFAMDKTVSNNLLEIGEAAFSRLNQYLPLKTDYLDFMAKLLKSGIGFDHDILLQFFERLPLQLRPLDPDNNNYQSYHYEHFKLVIHELFLYTVGLALQYRQYDLLRDLLHSRYLIKDRYASPKDTSDFTVFRYYYEHMDQYYKKLHNKNFHSVHADYIVNHVPDGRDRALLTDADLLCYYVGALNDTSWFPLTYIYRGRDRGPFDILSRLVSKKHFAKVKAVLGIDSSEILKEKMEAYDAQGKQRGYSQAFDGIPGFKSYIEPDQIGKAL